MKDRDSVVTTLKNIVGDCALTHKKTVPQKVNSKYLLDTFAKTRNIKSNQRIKTVSLPLDKVLCKKNSEDFRSKIEIAIQYLSKVRNLVGLASNYVVLKRLEEERPLPNLFYSKNDDEEDEEEMEESSSFSKEKSEGDKFFTACFSFLRGNNISSRYLEEEPDLKEDLQSFLDETGVPTLSCKGSFYQPITYLAQEMARCVTTRDKVSFEERRRAILRYEVCKIFEDTPDKARISEKLFKERRYALIVKILEYSDGSLLLSKVEDFAQESLLGTSDQIKLIRKLSIDEYQSMNVLKHTLNGRILHLYRRYKEVVKDDRLRFEQVINNSSLKHPGKERKRERSGEIKRQWPGSTPPREVAVLPLYTSGRLFIRIDRTALENWKLPYTSTPFWYEDIINPFRRKANIPDLRTRKNREYASSLDGFGKVLVRKHEKCPWLVGKSFMTDGIQIKLQLVTMKSSHPFPKNVDRLPEKGYKLGKESIGLGQILSSNRGVYSSKNVHTRDLKQEELDKLDFGGIDPGQESIVTMTQGHRLEDYQTILQDPTVISGKDYQEKCLFLYSKEHEEKRTKSNVAYGDAIEDLKTVKKRTSRLSAFVDYCKMWKLKMKDIFKETLSIARSGLRFKRFQAVQSCIDKMTKELSEKTNVVFFGDASFRAQKGHCSAPRKKLIRSLACRLPVIMQCERKTSSSCELCGGDMETIEYRILRCKNVQDGICSAVEGNRDVLASAHIRKKGLEAILTNLPNF